MVGFSIRADCSSSKLAKDKVTRGQTEIQRWRPGLYGAPNALTRSMGKRPTPGPFSEGLDPFARGRLGSTVNYG